MRKRLLTLCSLLATITLAAQSNNAITTLGTTQRRSEFVTYSTRTGAEKGNRSAEKFYIDLGDKLVSTTTSPEGNIVRLYEVELPLLWRDRSVFIHTEGGAAERQIFVGGALVGSHRDERTPGEFLITKYLKDGVTRIEIISPAQSDRRPAEMLGENPLKEQLFIYSQPAIHIHDVIVSAKPDATKKHGELKIQVVVNTTIDRQEKISVGYDIYSPEQELKYYDLREKEIKGKGLDTLLFETNIYGAMERLWSAESPKLYNVTLYLKRNGIISEYLNINVGFGETKFDAEGIIRNDKHIDIKAARYNATGDQKVTEADIKALKKRKINTLYIDYPQPYWFYDICDRVGMYVVEQANINTDPKGGDRSRKGTLANNPQWLNEFLSRVEASYFRVRMHPSVVAWSLGGPSGSGYNMYKCYEWLKDQEDSRPVIYSDGEWNSDLRLPEPLK